MTRHVPRRSALGLAGVAGFAALAGCGGGSDNGDENGDGGGDGPSSDDEAWTDVSEFYLEGRVEAWTFVEPSDVVGGMDNPTITLIEGNEYDFTWVNSDGVTHNLEIRDENDEVVEDYQSDDVGTEGEEASIEGLVATPEMTTYICQFHPSTQVGDIEVRSE